MAKVLRPIDYSSRDFVSLVADLQAAAPLVLPEWSTQNDLDFGNVMLDLFAYVGDIMSYYIDRVANEVFLQTATRRQSVVNISQMLGYTPVGMSAATTSVTFELVPGGGQVVVPAGTQVTTLPQAGSAPVVFETDIDLTIVGALAATPQFTGTVTATQGTTVTDEILSASASGGPNQEYTLFTTSVIEGSITITVTDAAGIAAVWTEVPHLLVEGAGDRVFQTQTDENGVVHILFGDNVHGLAPALGSLVLATYRNGQGAAGNVAADQLVEMVSPLTGIQSVTNPSPATGGEDEESIDSIRTNLPKSLTALQRAVTLNDYEALAIQVPGIAKAQAIATVYTSVLLYIAPVGVGGQVCTGPESTPGTQKYNVQHYFDERKVVNVTIVLADPTYIPVNIVATVHVLPNFYQPTVRNAVRTSLQTLLTYDAVDFAMDITTSQIYHAAQATEGVDYVSLTVLVRGDAATQAGVQDIVINNGEIPQAGVITLTMVGGVQ